MRRLAELLTALISLIAGATVWFWYLARSVADKSTMQMFLFVPILNEYEPTVSDYLTATALAAIAALMVYWMLHRITGMEFNRVPQQAP